MTLAPAKPKSAWNFISGQLSARKKKRFFEDLSEEVQSEIEEIVRDIFEFE